MFFEIRENAVGSRFFSREIIICLQYSTKRIRRREFCRWFSL